MPLIRAARALLRGSIYVLAACHRDHGLIHFDRLEYAEALAETVRARDMLSGLAKRGMNVVEELKHFGVIVRRMEIAAGVRKPQSAQEHAVLARVLASGKKSVAAAREYEIALESERDRATFNAVDLYSAAQVAALAASAVGDESEKWKQLAIEWIGYALDRRFDDLGIGSGRPATADEKTARRTTLTKMLRFVRLDDPALAAVRELAAFKDLLRRFESRVPADR